MSAKRRDNRNRILRNGESQRKDGRYMYSTLIMQEMQNMCIAGSWSRPTLFRKVQKTMFHFEIRKSRYIRIGR